MAPSDPSLTRWHADALASYAEKLERHQAEDIVSVVPMPTYQPPFRGMIVDALGYLWIDLGYEEDVSRRRHLIVGPDLEPHGVMTLPDLPRGGYLAEARSLPQAPRPLTLEPRR